MPMAFIIFTMSGLSLIGIPPFAVKKYSYQLQKFNKESLRKILSTCLDIEERSKSGRIEPQIGVELLIVSLCN